MRFGCLSYVNDMVDMSPNAKSNPEQLEDGLVLADRGDLDEIEFADGNDHDGPNAVRSRLRELLGCNG